MRPFGLTGWSLLGCALVTACSSEHVTAVARRASARTASVQQSLGESPPLDAPVSRHTATLLADGTVLIAGGLDDQTPPATSALAYRYVSSEVGIEALPALGSARYAHTATRLLDGSVLLAGGFDDSGDALASAELFDPNGPSFTTLDGALSVPRGDATATLLADGRVLVAGGYQTADHASSASGAELYDPAARSFSPVEDPGRHAGATLALTLASGQVALFWEDSPLDERFDPSTSALTQVSTSTLAPFDFGPLLAVSRMADQSVVVVGASRVLRLSPDLACEAGLSSCNGQCVSLDGSDNCGACGNACKDGEYCTAGHCDCGMGTTCAGQCSDTSQDPLNCGACGNACQTGEHCSQGTCTSDCAGQHRCGDGCSSLTDLLNCGACGVACAQGFQCAAGPHKGDPFACQCFGNLCDGVCYDQNDDNHCGDCATQCASNETCDSAHCVPTVCAGVFNGTPCGNVCADLSSDLAHCGTCDVACAGDQACRGGYCVPLACQGQLLPCNGSCVNVFSDNANCGGCGHVCDSRSGRCDNGQCQTNNSCGQGLTYCYGQCVDLRSNDQSCGGCFQACNTGFHCVDSRCQFAGGSDGTVGAARAAGTFWTTSANGAAGLADADKQVPGVEPHSLSLPQSITVASGDPASAGPGHSTTALPDGSLLVVGGTGTPLARRLYPAWTVSSDPVDRKPTGSSKAQALLPNGDLLIADDAQVVERNPTSLTQLARVPDGWSPLGAALGPSGSVLVLGSGGDRPGLLVDPSTPSAVPLKLNWAFASSAQGHAVALTDGGMLVAGHDGVELVSPPGSYGTLSTTPIPLDLGCDRPPLARLANGRVLVAGNENAFEIDVHTATASAPIELQLNRCGATITLRHDGSALLIGGSANNPSVERYDPAVGATKLWRLSGSLGESDPTTFAWFDQPWVFETSPVPAGAPAFAVNWQDDRLDLGLSYGLSGPHLLADGSLHAVSFPPQASLLRPAPPPASVGPFPSMVTLKMRDTVDFAATFPGHAFPGDAPEGGSGTTQSSPTNLPIPVWFPAEGGWPSVGTLVMADGKPTYFVPATPFPGLGLLFLATNGDLAPLGPLTIAPSAAGSSCETAGECASGYCTDGVCCDGVCDGACEACSKAGKHHGKDGVCETVAAGVTDTACSDEVATCGENGTCDGHGQCAKYADGAACAPDAACTKGRCVVGAPAVPPPPTPNSNGGNAGQSDSSQAGQAPEPVAHSTCNEEQQVIGPDGELLRECAPYRCQTASCLPRCDSTRDCVAGYACSAGGQCVTPAAGVTPSGCGCSTPRRARGSDAFVPLLALAAFLSRRARRRAAAARTALQPSHSHTYGNW